MHLEKAPLFRPFALGIVCLMLWAVGCASKKPQVERGREQKPYDDPGAPLSLVQISHIDSKPLRTGAVLKIQNHCMIEGEVERFPIGALLYVAARRPGYNWHLIQVPGDVNYTGEWKVSARLFRDEIVQETEVELKALILPEPPHQDDFEDAELRAITYQSSSSANALVMPGVGSGGKVSISVDAIQEQTPQAGRQIFSPRIFDASGSTHNVPPGAFVWVTAQCGAAAWQVISVADIDEEKMWSAENMVWPYRGGGSPMTCQLMVLIRREQPVKIPTDLANLEHGSLALTKRFSVIVTPAHLEVATFTGEDGRERQLASEAEEASVISNSSSRARIKVDGSTTRASEAVFLTLQPIDSVRMFIFGPGTRIDDGRWLFSGVPMAFPGYPQSKIVLIGAILSEVDLTGRALTQEELSNVGLGYAPLVHMAAAMGRETSPTVFKVIRIGDQQLPNDSTTITTLGSHPVEIEGESTSGRISTPFLGQRTAEAGRWHFQRCERSAGLAWQTLLVPMQTGRTGVGASGQVVISNGTEDLVSTELIDDEWRRAFSYGQEVVVPVQMPQRPTLKQFGEWLSEIGNLSEEQIGDKKMRDVESLVINALTLLAGFMLLSLSIWIAPRILRRSRMWWRGFWDARKDLPTSSSYGPAERGIMAGWSARVAKVRGAFAKRLASARSSVETLVNKLKTESEDLADKQTESGRKSPDVHLSSRGKLTLGLVMISGENAFNLSAFDVFRQPVLETIVMAFSVGVAVPLCAQLLGVWLRQWPKPSWRTSIWAICLSSLCIWILLGLNSVRIMVLENKDPGFLVANPHLGAAIFPVNVAVLLASAIAVYMSLDALPGFAEVYQRVVRLEKKLSKATDRLRTLEAGLAARIEFLQAQSDGDLFYYRVINDRYRHTPRDEAPRPRLPANSHETTVQQNADAFSGSIPDKEVKPTSQNGTRGNYGH